MGTVRGVADVADALTKYHGIEKLLSPCRLHGVVCGPDDKDRQAEGEQEHTPERS